MKESLDPISFPVSPGSCSAAGICNHSKGRERSYPYGDPDGFGISPCLDTLCCSGILDFHQQRGRVFCYIHVSACLLLKELISLQSCHLCPHEQTGEILPGSGKEKPILEISVPVGSATNSLYFTNLFSSYQLNFRRSFYPAFLPIFCHCTFGFHYDIVLMKISVFRLLTFIQCEGLS